MKKLLLLFCVSFLFLFSFSQNRTEDWTLEKANAEWKARDSQGEVVFKNKLWILGGWENSFKSALKDVWFSKDGKDWELATDNAPWDHGDLPMTIVFKNRIFLMGGWHNGRMEGHRASNKIWSSGNGKKWRLEKEHAEWSPRLAAAVVEFKGKLWLMGGIENYYFGDEKSLKNDVWFSRDGKHWELATDSAQWQPRAFHQAAVLKGKMYVFGGGNYVPEYFALNDVWSTVDGIHWKKETDRAPWHERIWFSSVVYRNKIWIMAGWSNNPFKNWNDVWFTEDGGHWQRLKSERIWEPRHEPSAFVFKDKMWLMGGNTPPLVNDVWSIKLPKDF